MQGSARKDVVFGTAQVYTVAVPGLKWESWLKWPVSRSFCAYKYEGQKQRSGNYSSSIKFNFGKGRTWKEGIPLWQTMQCC